LSFDLSRVTEKTQQTAENSSIAGTPTQRLSHLLKTKRAKIV